MNQLFDWLTACPLQWGCLFFIFFLIPFMFILGIALTRTASHSEYCREGKERRYYWMQDCKDSPTEVERKKLERIRIALMNCVNKNITGNNKKRWWERGKTKFPFPL